jgi:hypothetical protein
MQKPVGWQDHCKWVGFLNSPRYKDEPLQPACDEAMLDGRPFISKFLHRE